MKGVSVSVNNTNFQREDVLDALFLFSLTSLRLFSDFILLLAVRNLSQRLYGAGLLSPPPQFVILLTQTLSYFSILIIRRQSDDHLFLRSATVV